MKTMYVDMDSTLCEHWPRILWNSGGGVIRKSAFSDDEIMSDLPIPGAREALRKFKKAGWRIVVLTSRFWEGAEAITRRWLDNYGMAKYVDDVVCVPSMAAKIPYLVKQADANLVVDDFMYGQESWPGFYTEEYRRMVNLGLPVVVFRNNWEEIVVRWCK